MYTVLDSCICPRTTLLLSDVYQVAGCDGVYNIVFGYSPIWILKLLFKGGAPGTHRHPHPTPYCLHNSTQSLILTANPPDNCADIKSACDT